MKYRLTAEDWERLLTSGPKKNITPGPGLTDGHRNLSSITKFSLDSGHVNVHLVVKNGVIQAVELADQSVESSSAHQMLNEFMGERYDLRCVGDMTIKQ